MNMVTKIINLSMIAAGRMMKDKFDKITLDPKKINEKILLEIINSSKESEFGQKYDFSNINSINLYQKKVPLSKYSDYKNYIERMINGEENILVSNKVEFFGRTSGTTGSQKYIPFTKKGRGIVAPYMVLLTQRVAYESLKEKWCYEKGLSLMDMRVSSKTESGVPISSGTSGGMRSIKRLIPYMWTSPIEVMEIKDKETSMYLHLLFALAYKNLMYINATFISSILDLFRLLEENYDDLLNDLENGTISKKIKLDDNVRETLNSYLKENKDRAREIREEFKIGTQGIVKRIWPNLYYIGSVSGASFSIYDNAVRFYIEDIPIYSNVYAATEGCIGINMNIDKYSYIAIPDTAFLEFIPVENSNESQPLTKLIDELEVNHAYEVVISNFSGLYRYRIGDVIKVVGYYNQSPEIVFLYRKNQLLNMVSEKTSEDHVIQAIKNTDKELKLNIVDYSTRADNSTSPGRYVFYLETKDNIKNIDKLLIEKTLDENLKKSNQAYGRHRDYNSLRTLKVFFLNRGTFRIIKEYLIKKGTSKNQVKIPRVITNCELLEILKQNINY